jgi:hypothetical protein
VAVTEIIIAVMNTPPATYTYRFDRFGSSYHVRIETMTDLIAAMRLDPALWVATSMPIPGVAANDTFLRLVDSDSDGRITHKEVCEAITWVEGVLADFTAVDSRTGTIVVDTLNPDHPAAADITSTIKRIASERSSSINSIDPDLLSSVKKELLRRPLNEKGIILPEVADESAISEIIHFGIQATGGTPHPGGSTGLDESQYNRFVSLVKAYLSIHAESISMSVTIPGLDVVSRHRSIIDKIDEYYRLCAAAMFQQPVVETTQDPRALDELPLAKVRNDCVLSFEEFINPAYADALESFRKEVMRRVEDDLEPVSQHEWQNLRDTLRQGEKLADRLDSFGEQALTALKSRSISDLEKISSGEQLEEIRQLIQSSKEAAFAIGDIELIEKLSLYQRHLLDLANNFVSFPDLYDRSARAWFEMGTLVIDNRTFSLSVLVEDRAKHVVIAKNSSMYVLYVRVRASKDSELFEVAVPVTAGGRGNLYVGKRGVFTDRSGSELDAVVVEIIDNPIDVLAAVLAPIRRLAKTVTGKLETLTSEADQNLQQYVGTTVEGIRRHDAQPVPVASGVPAGTATTGAGIGTAIFGGSVAIAAIGSAIAYIANTLTSMRWWQVFAGFGGVLAAVVIPAIFLAMLKLRRRDMSAIIEASGWAVNTRMKLTRYLQRTFSAAPAYPKNARGTPFRKRSVLIISAAIVVIVAVCTVLVISVLAEGGFTDIK